MTQDQRIVRRQVRDLTNFYLHVLAFVLVTFGLFVIDAVQGGRWWLYWAAIPWGCGVVAHGVTVLVGGRRMAAWEERRLDEYIDEATNPDMEPISAGPRPEQHPLV